MKNINMKYALLLLIIGLGFGVQAQDNGEILVPLTNPGQRANVKVDLRKGSIRVVGTARKDVLVKYSAQPSRKSEKNSKDGLKRISSAAMDLEITEKDNYVEIESDSWNKGVDVVVEVPSDVDLHVETYNNGDIYVENISGEIVADNYNGKITAESISGSLVADTYNGSIKARFNTVSSDTPMAFTTYNGDVDLTFPGSFKCTLKMKTNQGDIYSGFDFDPVKSEPVTKKDKNSETFKVYLDEWVKGKVNGGGSEIMVKNYNGDIYIRKI